MALTFRLLNTRDVKRLLEKWGFRSVMRATKKVFNFHTVLMVSKMRTEDLSGPTTKRSVSARSGKLRANLKAKRAHVVAGSIVAGVNAGTAYAGVHIGKRGRKTTIRPKNARYLTIPLEAAKTKAGVARGSARSGMFGDTFIMKSKSGNLLIMGKRRYQKGAKAGQTHGNLAPLFVLKKRVVVRARVDTTKRVKEVKRTVTRDIIQELKRG